MRRESGTAACNQFELTACHSKHIPVIEPRSKGPQVICKHKKSIENYVVNVQIHTTIGQ